MAVTGAAATVSTEQGPPASAGTSGERQDRLEDAEDRAAEKADEKAEKRSVKAAEKADRRDAQEAFVAAKQSWSECVSEARPDADGAFDPEQACGSKPRNPRAATGRGSTKDEPGPPPWAGGPGERSQESPDQAKKDA